MPIFIEHLGRHHDVPILVDRELNLITDTVKDRFDQFAVLMNEVILGVEVTRGIRRINYLLIIELYWTAHCINILCFS